jgi:hypothetical protein
VVPVDPEIRKTIFDEGHMSKFSIHPGSTKMYQDLKQNFWWSNMKVDIAKYVAECDTCHRMKASHLKSAVYSNPCRYLCGNGTTITQIEYFLLARNILSGLLWTDSPRLPISLQFILLIQCSNMQSYTWIK